MYFDSPRVIAVSNSLVDFDPATQDGHFGVEVDVLRNSPRRLMQRRGKLKSAAIVSRSLKGIVDSIIEGEILEPIAGSINLEVTSSFDIFSQALSREKALVPVSVTNLDVPVGARSLGRSEGTNHAKRSRWPGCARPLWNGQCPRPINDCLAPRSIPLPVMPSSFPKMEPTRPKNTEKYCIVRWMAENPEKAAALGFEAGFEDTQALGC